MCGVFTRRFSCFGDFMMADETSYFIGVDVGTGSARAALVNKNGKILRIATEPIKTWTPKVNFFEQSSDDIWASCCKVVKEVAKDIAPECVKGVGMDATCSLVALDKQGKPISVSPSGQNEQNIILWMDHRAVEEAAYINSLNNTVLKYVGGKISLEMETPKLLWLKKHLKQQCWDKAGYFFDLPDFLTWKATGSESRSLCSLVCKWTYEAEANKQKGWSAKYFDEIGLGELKENDWQKIGSVVCSPGEACPGGLTVEAARDLALLQGTPVATSIIDAHAGGLGMMGCSAPGVNPEFQTRLGLICGTSTCHMAVSKHPHFVPGVWGPYYSAMVPGYWLNEGGQSATGKLIDHVIDSHPASSTIKEKIQNKMHIQTYLSNLLAELAFKRNLESPAFLTKDVHVWPDFHGNRSPLADPSLLGMISGLNLSNNEESLAILYLATVQALAYGTRHIIEALHSSGYAKFESILICGGLSSNPLFVQMQADVVGLPVLCPHEAESVLLGAAILGACAAGSFSSIEAAIKGMGGQAKVVPPNANDYRYHSKKYKVFLKMVEDQKLYHQLMS